MTTAVIGTGFIGPAHVEALARVGNVDIVGIASNEPDRAREIAARFNIPRVYDRWEDAIADPTVQVVHNCTPNHLHFAINKAALLAGKHVVSEKPLAMTSKESFELVALAKKQRLVTAVNFNYRFYPLIQHVRSLIRRGELGSIHLIHGHYLQDWLLLPTDYNWRLEPEIGGVSRAVADIGSHWFDLIQHVTGSAVQSVCADLLTIHSRRVRPAGAVATFETAQRTAGGPSSFDVATEDAATILFRMETGARGSLTVSQVSAGRKNREWFEIDGSKASLAWNQEEPNTLWMGKRDGPNEILIKDPSLLSKEARPYAHYPGGHPEGFPDGIKNFFIRFYHFLATGNHLEGSEPPFATFSDGHRENLIVEAVSTSSRLRRWVDITADALP